MSPEVLEAVIALADRAADRIMAVYDRDFAVEHKEDDTPLTAADLAAHRTICEGLETVDPKTPVLSEESAEIPFRVRSGWHRYWLVDPLDGTREFVKRNGEFTVNIALVEDHAPVVGVVWVPVSGDCYFAAAGQGAFVRRRGEERRRIRVRRCPEDRIVVAGSRSHGNAATRAFIRNLGTSEKIAIGSSLKTCLVAEGRVDVYPRFGPTSEWDTAAAQCVLEEAGGRLTDVRLEPLRYNTKDSLLNPHFLAFGDAAVDWRRFVEPAQPS